MTGKILDVITSPVTVITTKFGDKINGMTVAWIAQVSLNPSLIMVSIAPQRYTHELIQKSKVFAVNVLADDQVAIGRLFGTMSGRNKDKFCGIKYDVKKTGSPILKGTYAYLECNVISASRAGDHTIFVGEVVDCSVDKNKKPLVFRAGDYF